MSLRPAVVSGTLALVLLLGACGSDNSPTTSGTPTAAPSSEAGCTTTPQTGPDNFRDSVALTAHSDGLKTGDFRVGCGTAAAAGDSVTVAYTGWTTDGTKFDSSRDRDQPFTTQLTTDSVIPGWVEGIAGMKVGGKRRLVIPAPLAYGAAGYPPAIGPNATLIFDVELLNVQKP